MKGLGKQLEAVKKMEALSNMLKTDENRQKVSMKKLCYDRAG